MLRIEITNNQNDNKEVHELTDLFDLRGKLFKLVEDYSKSNFNTDEVECNENKSEFFIVQYDAETNTHIPINITATFWIELEDNHYRKVGNFAFPIDKEEDKVLDIMSVKMLPVIRKEYEDALTQEQLDLLLHKKEGFNDPTLVGFHKHFDAQYNPVYAMVGVLEGLLDDIKQAKDPQSTESEGYGLPEWGTTLDDETIKAYERRDFIGITNLQKEITEFPHDGKGKVGYINLEEVDAVGLEEVIKNFIVDTNIWSNDPYLVKYFGFSRIFGINFDKVDIVQINSRKYIARVDISAIDKLTNELEMQRTYHFELEKGNSTDYGLPI